MDIKEEILTFINREEETGALLITGKWGSGKSYYIKGLAKELNDNKREYLCVISLFGIDSVASLVKAVKECYLESGEGCLSVDKVHEGFVYRHYKVTVKTYDLLKKSLMTYTFTGYPAIIVQHEIDHLKGVLFYDHINKESPFIRKSGAISI